MQRTPDGDRRGFVAAAPEGLKLRRYARPNAEQTWPFPRRGVTHRPGAASASVLDLKFMNVDLPRAGCSPS